MTNISGILLFSVLLLCSLGTGIEVGWGEEIRQEHNMDDYAFTTTAHVHTHEKYDEYKTCVVNRSDRDLEFNWYIPGPHSWILANQWHCNSRLRLRSDTLSAHRGCLRYGTQWEPLAAEFIPHRCDINHIDYEQEVGCSQMVNGEHHGLEACTDPSVRLDDGGDIFKVRTRLTVFAPALTDRPEETMIRLDATVEISPTDDETRFKHVFEISPTQVGRNFRPELLQFLPMSGLLCYEYTGADDCSITIPINNGEVFTATPLVPLRPKLGEVRFHVMNGNGDHAATLFVPFWLQNL